LRSPNTLFGCRVELDVRCIGTEGFERRFGNLFTALFSETQPRRASFRNVHWTFVLLTPDALGSRNSFEVLFRAISQVGDIEIVITSLDFLPRHRWSYLISCDYPSYIEALWHEEEGLLMASTKALFGPSGNWAAIVDEGGSLGVLTRYTIVGGEPPFIDSLISSYGGAKQLREKFLRHLSDSHIQPPMSREAQSSLLSDAGW